MPSDFRLLLIAATISFVLCAANVYAQAPAGPAVRITAPIDETALTTLRGNTHPLARLQFDQGAAPADLPMDRMLLVLKRSPEQESALQTLLDEQHDKSSPNYHRWLTPDEFGQQFGPADQDIQAVTSWLSSHGFRVAHVGRGRTAIEFSGTAAQVRDAFHTEIHSYVAGGAQHWANSADPQIPAALAPVISGIAALHNFPVKPLHHVAGLFSKSAATGEVKRIDSQAHLQAGTQFTVSDPSCGPQPCYAVGPYDFATIYNVLPLWNGTPAIDGTGQSIAIVGQSNINMSDVDQFRSMFGLPTNDPTVILDGPDPGVTHDNDETEALLDLEWAGAVAPRAAIEFITSASTDTTAGVDLSALYAVENNVAPVLSVSFGLCELFLGATGNQFHSALWEQAAAQGITVVVASGDSGSAGCDSFNGIFPEPAQNGLAVSGFASTPFNVAVGGTDFLNFGTSFDLNNPSPYWNATNSAAQTTPAILDVSAKGYVPESTWNDSCTSQAFALPIFGFESTAEGRCNDPNLAPLVVNNGGSGGRSNCINPMTISPSSCSGSGGYSQPSWQSTVGDGARDLPDVSLFASNGFWNSFYILCEADLLPPVLLNANASCSLQNGFANFVGIGGTSASAPAFAGIMALINQYTNSTTGQGNANYELYKLTSVPSQLDLNCNSINGPNSACIFNDVTFGTIAMPCLAGSTADCTLLVPSDSYGVLSGYDAGPGYDRATGLGSVNAFNLAQNWSKAKFNSTTTTLALDGVSSGSVTNITHGTGVPVVVTVQDTSGGQPTGDVSLIATPLSSSNPPPLGAGIDSHALTGLGANSSSTPNWTTTFLPGGRYNVHAHYAGDNTFGSSDSTPPISVTVNPETSATSLSASTLGTGDTFVPLTPGQNLSYGTTVYLKASVTSATNAHDTAPTGLVTFTDANGGSQAYSLNSQGVAIAGNGLCNINVGVHSFTASYSGDNSYQASASNPTAPITFNITQATPQVNAFPTQTVALNSTFPLLVTVGENNGLLTSLTGSFCRPARPTGTVTLFDGNVQVGLPVTLSDFVGLGAGEPSAALAIFNVPASAPLQLGSNTLTAQYNGDANYAAAPGTINVQVGFPTATVLTSSNEPVAVSENVTFTAQITSSHSGSPAITGTVFFAIDSQLGAPVPVVNGSAQYTTSFASTTPNSHQIRALYSGDPNYAASNASLQELVVPDFTLSDSIGGSGGIMIAAPGDSSAPITVTITGTSGYNGTVDFSSSSCVITPAGSLSSCAFSPSAVTGSGSTQLIINTTAPHTATAPLSQFGVNPTQLLPLTACLAFFATLIVFERRRRISVVFASVILLALFGLWACGGGSGNNSQTPTANTIPGTPTGVPYTVTVNAAPSGSNAHSVNFSFTVQ